MSKSLSLIKNKNDENINSISRQQIIKKNKIINIRIYQNYSSDKNSNIFFNPCTNNIINNINIPLNVINETGTQTIIEEKDKKIMKKKNLKNEKNRIGNSLNNKTKKELQKNEKHYNFNKTFSVGFKKKKVIKSDNKICKRKNKNMIKNHSYNINFKKKKIVNLKGNVSNKKDKKKIFEVNEDLNNSNNNNSNKTNRNKKVINYNNKNNEINNRSDEKNKVAKKYSLFNLKNDNKYLIINDGNYDSHYHENSKISINNIYIKKENKIELDKNQFFMKGHNIANETKFENHRDGETNFHSSKFLLNNSKKANPNDNNDIKIKENKTIINSNKDNIINMKHKFENLSIVKNNDILINEGKRFNDINNININKNQVNINDNKEFYSKFITNIHSNINKFFFDYGNKIEYDEKNIIKKIYNNDKIYRQKLYVNDITKNNFQILSKNNKKENKEINQIKSTNKENNKINKNIENNKNNKIKNNILIVEKSTKEKQTKKENPKRQYIKLKENKNTNKKYESFFNDMTQEDENGIKFEDLLKTYTEESIKENPSMEEINNKIIGDEKTFFNNSKIPKIEECNPNQGITKENNMNIYNQNKNPNFMNNKRKNYFENNFGKKESNKMGLSQEKDIFKILKEELNNKKEEDKFYKIIKSKNYINNNHYIFNIDKNYQKNLNKEKMYNFLFNEKSPLKNYINKEPLMNSQDKENDDINIVNTIINKMNMDIKSSTATQFFKKYNTSRINFPKNNYRNKSYKNSYSKYYLNKLELENKLLIPQLSKKMKTFLI